MTASLNFPLIGIRLALLIFCASLVGCSSIGSDITRDTLKVYVPEVVQGNFVSKEQRQALTLGMPSSQVRDILGTPLVTSLFRADRWDYAFSIRRQGIAPQSFQLTLFFKDGLLESIEGGDLPSEAEFVERLVVGKKTLNAPNLQATEEELKKFPAQKSQADAPRKAPLPTNYPPLEPTPR